MTVPVDIIRVGVGWTTHRLDVARNTLISRPDNGLRAEDPTLICLSWPAPFYLRAYPNEILVCGYTSQTSLYTHCCRLYLYTFCKAESPLSHVLWQRGQAARLLQAFLFLWTALGLRTSVFFAMHIQVAEINYSIRT